MKTIEIPADRLIEFKNGLSESLALSISKTVAVIGEPGAGKSVLGKAFAESDPSVHFVELDSAVFFEAGEKVTLDIGLRKRYCVIDEPRRYSNLFEFLSVRGEPVVLMLQSLHEIPFLGLEDHPLVLWNLLPYSTWKRTAQYANDVIVKINRESKP